MKLSRSASMERAALCASLSAALAATAAPAGAVVTAINRFSSASATSPPLTLRSARPFVPRSATPYVVTSYTLTDVGAPAGYTLMTPVSLNNNGQIFGKAKPATSTYIHCLAWTGSAWVDAQAAKSLNCNPAGISDKNVATGTFTAVGGSYVPTDNDEVAMLTTFSATAAKTKLFTGNVSSTYVSANPAGAVAGDTFYAPFGGFSSTSPPVTGSNLALLQPKCVTALPGCMTGVVGGFSNATYTRMLGTRAVNGSGTILGVAANPAAGAYIEYTPGTPPTYMQFDLPVLAAGTAGIPYVGMDNAGRVPYTSCNASSTCATLLYDAVAKTTTNLGSFAGSTCAQYVPVAINAAGKILGYTNKCSNGADYVDWTWDATNGLVNVEAGFNPGSTVRNVIFQSINDLGQLLVEFDNATTGKHDWGWLNPGTTAVRSNTAIRSNRSAPVRR